MNSYKLYYFNENKQIRVIVFIQFNFNFSKSFCIFSVIEKNILYLIGSKNIVMIIRSRKLKFLISEGDIHIFDKISRRYFF